MAREERVRLVHEIDAGPSRAAARQVEQDWSQAHARLDERVKQTAGIVQRAAVGATAAIGAVTAGVAAQEKAWISLGTSVLAAFAAGGPVAGAIAIFGAGVGFLSQAVKPSETFTRQLDRTRAAAADAQKTMLAMFDSLREAQGETEFDRMSRAIRVAETHTVTLTRRLDELDRKIVESRQSFDFFGGGPLGELSALEADREKVLEMLDQNIQKVDALRTAYDLAIAREEELHRRRLEAAREFVELETRFLRMPRGTVLQQFDIDETRRFEEERRVLGDDLAQQLSQERTSLFLTDLRDRSLEVEESMRRQLEVLQEMDPFERARLEVANEMAAVQRALAEQSLLTPEIERTLAEISKARQDLILTDFEATMQTVGPGLAGTITDSVVDGFRTGFKNVNDIWSSFLGNLGASLLNLGVSFGLQALLGGAGGGAASFLGLGGRIFDGGGTFVTAGGPAVFATSANGIPELVDIQPGKTTITPVTDASTRGGDVHFGGITLHVSGGRRGAEELLDELGRVLRTSRGKNLLRSSLV